jgi:hypothetical protein
MMTTMAHAASKVAVSRRRTVSGQTHAAPARMVAKPAWIHSEVRIDLRVLRLLEIPERVIKTVMEIHRDDTVNEIIASSQN